MSFTVPQLGMSEEIVGQVSNPPDRQVIVSAADRIRTRRSILLCTACELSSKCKAPVPWDGPAPNDFLVVGEAPGATEDRVGKPFVGVSGMLLRNTLRMVGVDPDLLTFANSIQCWPTFKPPTPRLEHLEACASNLARIIRVVAPRYVLLVGAVALGRFRWDLRITTAHGRPFTVPSPWSPAARGGALWCYPVIHPASILRDGSQREAWTQDLTNWVQLISTPPEQLSTHLPMTCSACTRVVDRYDPDGVAWCDGHYAKGEAGWKAAVKKRAWMMRTEQLVQGGMGTPGMVEPEKRMENPT